MEMHSMNMNKHSRSVNKTITNNDLERKVSPGENINPTAPCNWNRQINGILHPNPDKMQKTWVTTADWLPTSTYNGILRHTICQSWTQLTANQSCKWNTLTAANLSINHTISLTLTILVPNLFGFHPLRNSPAWAPSFLSMFSQVQTAAVCKAILALVKYNFSLLQCW